MYEERWGSLKMDWVVMLLALPSLVLLGFLLSSGDAVGPTEQSHVLAASSLLLIVSVFVCCYVTHRLGLACCIVGHTSTLTEALVPWQKNTTYTAPLSYDTFINMESSDVTMTTKGAQSKVEPGIHKSWTQRASMEQGCYQNLRPQEDNG